MSPQDKKPYEQMREVEQRRFEMQMSDLMSKGYFLMEDGSKSSEYCTVVKQVADKKSQKNAKALVINNDWRPESKNNIFKIESQKEHFIFILFKIINNYFIR